VGHPAVEVDNDLVEEEVHDVKGKQWQVRFKQRNMGITRQFE
jgi:hypothetical protein